MEYKVAKESERYSQINVQVVDKERELDALGEHVRENMKRAEQAEVLYETIKGEGDDLPRSRFIDIMVENQRLKEDNANLRDGLRKACDFMESIVLEGRNMLRDLENLWVGRLCGRLIE